MANWKYLPKAGMEGRTTRTSRWGRRAEVKEACKTNRRILDKRIIEEQLLE